MGLQVKESVIVGGVDVGGTELKGLLVELKDGELPKVLNESIAYTPSRVKEGPKTVADTVIPGLLDLSVSKIGLERSRLSAIGFDFPCALNAETGSVLDVANMKNQDWINFDLKAALKKSLPEKGYNPKVIVLENDGLAGVYALRAELRPEEKDQVIIGIFIGTGVGGAALINGKNFFNNEGGGSEPGATKILFDEDPYLYGKYSAPRKRLLEEYSSLTALERQVRDMMQAGVIPQDHELHKLTAVEGESIDKTRAKKILGYADSAFQAGNMDHFSIRLVEVQIEVLANYLHGHVQWMRPKVIAIGGGVTDPRRVSKEFANWFVNSISEKVIADIPQAARREKGLPRFLIPESGDSTTAFGAALMAAEALKSAT